MVHNTPEYVSAHLRELADDKPQKVGPELIERYREERRRRRAAFVTRMSKRIPFVGRPKSDVTGSKPTPAT